MDQIKRCRGKAQWPCHTSFLSLICTKYIVDALLSLVDDQQKAARKAVEVDRTPAIGGALIQGCGNVELDMAGGVAIRGAQMLAGVFK